MAQALKQGASLAIGVDHPEYRAEIPAVPPQRAERAGRGPGVRRLAILWLAIALAAGGCGGAKRVDEAPDEEGEEPRAARQAAVKFPALPEGAGPAAVRDATATRRSSTSWTGARSRCWTTESSGSRSWSGPRRAVNVSYEGYRCITRERRTYGRANRDGTWIPVKDAGWVSVGPREVSGFRHELYWQLLLPREARHQLGTRRRRCAAVGWPSGRAARRHDGWRIVRAPACARWDRCTLCRAPRCAGNLPPADGRFLLRGARGCRGGSAPARRRSRGRSRSRLTGVRGCGATPPRCS